MKAELDRQLANQPPQFSAVMINPVANTLAFVDQDDRLTMDWWVAQTLTDIDRFNRKFPDSDELDHIEAYATDFFTAWSASSTEVVQILGFERTLDILKRLRKFWFVTWQAASISYLEMENFGPEFKVFRGESKRRPIGEPLGFSWSLSRSTAEGYAKRHPEGVLHIGRVLFENMLLFHVDELEVVVTPGSVVIDETIDL